MTEMLCPRRMEGPFRQPAHDEWMDRNGRKHCSYCGSLHPDELFAAIDQGAELTPTDKSYKVYVDLPHPQAGQPCVLSTANFKPEGDGWVEVNAESRKTLPLDERQQRDYRDGDYVRVEPRPDIATEKFYFQHLSAEQQQRFVDLLNQKKIKLAYPGHFYVRPFFIAVAKPAEQAAG